MKILKILSFYHVQFQNYNCLNYGLFGLDIKLLQCTAFWNCFYSVSFNCKHFKFWMVTHFQELFRTFLAKIFKLTTSIFFGHFQRAKLIRKNPEGLQLIVPILYQDLSGFKLVSFRSELLQLSKGGPNWVLDPKTLFSSKFCRLKCPYWQFQKDLKFSTFYPTYFSTLLANFQLWHRSSLISGSMKIKIFF